MDDPCKVVRRSDCSFIRVNFCGGIVLDGTVSVEVEFFIIFSYIVSGFSTTYISV